LANAIAEFKDDLQEVEDGFVNRIINQQDVNDAFNDDEPEALACAHIVVIDDVDDAVGDDFVVVDNAGAVHALDSSVDDLIAPSLNEEVPVPIVPSPIDIPSPIATSSDKDVAVPIVPSPIDTSSDKDVTVPIVPFPIDTPSPIVTSSDKDVAVPIAPSPIDTPSPFATSSDKDAAIPIVPSPIATPSNKDVAGRHEARDQITAIFAVAVAVIDIKFTGCPHTINNVIEYADALIFKLSTINIHSAQQLHLIVKDGHQVINNKLS
jgi:hypothetical protein